MKYLLTGDNRLYPENSWQAFNGKECFEVGNNQQEIVIPEGVATISMMCFHNNKSVKKFVLPKSLMCIEGKAFSCCDALEEIVIPDGVSLENARGLFEYCKSLKRVVLPAGLKTIAREMFKGCQTLKEVVIPDSVVSIGGYAFYGCTYLKQITLPEKLTGIGEYAFKDCTLLKNIVFPEGLTSIQWNAFSGCTALEEIVIPESVRSLTSYQIFEGCTSLRRIEIKGARAISRNVFSGCTAVEEVILSADCSLGWMQLQDIPRKKDEASGTLLSKDGRILLDIAEENPTEQSKITELVIPEGVTHIAGPVLGFRGKHNIQKITLPESLLSIGEGALKEHPYQEIVLPANVRTIGESAFYRCRELERAVLNDGLRTIGDGAFAECGKLREIVIPASVEYIGKKAFVNCGNLEKVTILGNVKVIGADMFSGCPKAPVHILPDTITSFIDWSDEPFEFIPNGKVDAVPAQNKKLSGMLPFMGVKTIAQLIVHQKGKAIVEEISQGLGQNIGKIDLNAIARAICEEIASVKKKAFDTAVTFFTDYAEQLSAEDIKAFIAVLEKKKAQKNADSLNANAAIQKKLSEQSDEPAGVNEHPMESTLSERISKVFAKESIATIRKTARDMRAKEQIPDGLKYADGAPVSDDAFAFMVCAAEGYLSLMPEHDLNKDGWQEAEPLVEALDKDVFIAALHRIFDEKMYAKNAWLVALMCIFGDEALLAKVISMKNKWADWYTWGTVGKELNRSLDHWTLHSPTREALVFADKNNRLAWYAQIHHTTEEALRNQLLADFGFDEKGVRIFRAGEAEIEATLNPDASVQLFNRKTKKTIKTFPKKGEPNDGEVFAAWKKQLATVVKSRIKSLKDAFTDGNMCSFEKWQSENCMNPIYSALAKGVVWGVYDEKKNCVSTFRLNENMETVGADGDAVQLQKDQLIGVMHPVDCTWEEIKAWKSAFSLIAQPIPQLDTPVRLPDIKTLASRYEGCKVSVGKLLHGMNGHEEEGAVVGGNDTVSITVIHGYDYWSEYEITGIQSNDRHIANKRKYSTDILEIDNLLNPFTKAEAAIDEKNLEAVRDMVERGLILRENIQQMISRAADADAVEISLYLIELSRQWGVAEDEDDLSL